MTIRAGVIGLGVGERHVASYQNIEDVEVAAICDIDRAKCDDVGDRLGVGRRCSSYREITEDDSIDVVSICSYDSAHAEQVISALNHGKHVMVEKPVALYREELEGIVEAQQRSGKFVTSNLILRESPRFKALKKRIDDGLFGDLVYLEGDYIHQILWKITEGWRGKQDFYCVAYGGGIHLIDLMRWLANDEVTEVSGMANKFHTANSGFAYPDMTVNLLKFENGAIAKTMTTFNPNRPHFHALQVFGTKRSFVNSVPVAWEYEGEDSADCHVIDDLYPGYDKGDLLPDLIDAVRQQREPGVSSRDVFRVMDICLACWNSIRTGETIKIDYTI